jgi:hypothetical protein
MRENLSVLPGRVVGTSRIHRVAPGASMVPARTGPRRAEGKYGTMHLAHAIAAGALSARTTDRRFRATEAEVAEAERRVVERRRAAVATSAAREYTERGRHAAPRPARPRPASA